MSWLTEIAAFGAAYMFLSICVGLVVGRILRNLDVTPEIGTPELIEAARWNRAEETVAPSGGMIGAVLS